MGTKPLKGILRRSCTPVVRRCSSTPGGRCTRRTTPDRPRPGEQVEEGLLVPIYVDDYDEDVHDLIDRASKMNLAAKQMANLAENLSAHLVVGDYSTPKQEVYDKPRGGRGLVLNQSQMDGVVEASEIAMKNMSCLAEKMNNLSGGGGRGRKTKNGVGDAVSSAEKSVAEWQKKLEILLKEREAATDEEPSEEQRTGFSLQLEKNCDALEALEESLLGNFSGGIRYPTKVEDNTKPVYAEMQINIEDLSAKGGKTRTTTTAEEAKLALSAVEAALGTRIRSRQNAYAEKAASMSTKGGVDVVPPGGAGGATTERPPGIWAASRELRRTPTPGRPRRKDGNRTRTPTPRQSGRINKSSPVLRRARPASSTGLLSRTATTAVFTKAPAKAPAKEPEPAKEPALTKAGETARPPPFVAEAPEKPKNGSGGRAVSPALHQGSRPSTAAAKLVEAIGCWRGAPPEAAVGPAQNKGQAPSSKKKGAQNKTTSPLCCNKVKRLSW